MSGGQFWFACKRKGVMDTDWFLLCLTIKYYIQCFQN
jgi:hypothetical protein